MVAPIGLSNLTFLSVPGLTSFPMMAAYCISAPIISVFIVALSAGAIFDPKPESTNSVKKIVGILSIVWLWIYPGHARTGGSYTRLFYMFLCAALYIFIDSPLLLLNIIIISSKWWWWLFMEGTHWTFLSLWGRIPKLTVICATIYSSFNILADKI